MDMSFCYMIRQFVFGQKRFAAYLAHRLRSQWHFSADAIRLENKKVTKKKTGRRKVWTEKEYPLFVTEVVVVNRRRRRSLSSSSPLSKSKTNNEIRMEKNQRMMFKNKPEKLILDSSFILFVCVMDACIIIIMYNAIWCVYIIISHRA